MTSAIKMNGITKIFPGVVANDKIDFVVEKAEIHGLLGENGAGKTVLMSILYGLYWPDEGQIFVNEQEVKIDSPSKAIKLGIGMVHQHFMLIPSLTVAENIILGKEPTKNKVLLDMNRTLKDVKDFCERYKLEVDLTAPVYTQPVGVQQRVEILKALYRGADILILDEPTSVLTPQEVEELFKAIRALKEQGKTVIFISHKLREVLAICDRITVLRRGKVVGTAKTDETDMDELAKMMVGRKIIFTFKKKQVRTTEVVLKVENLKAIDDRGLPALKGVTFEVCTFEILGIAGVEGNGQTELAEVLTGLRKAIEGKILVDNTDITRAPPGERIRLGISHVPEDRHKRGLIPDFSVMENLILGSHNRPPFTTGRVRLNFEEATNYAKRLISDFSIKTPSKDTPVQHLSGGTQQRVIVAREFSRKPKLIIVSQPTRGLDVGATEYVRKKLLEMRDQGCAILLISADLDEIWALSDRIVVIYEGQIVAIKDPKKTSEGELGLLMAGGKHG
ncbi:MAG: ABC transporter ATP-binding protein [Candidatus Bathyarchaeota archaeon]|nr:ABC transporter ATP-binding protein [Candidatus Bathyarchaeota archaeon]